MIEKLQSKKQNPNTRLEKRLRGRPKKFDFSLALEQALALFWAQGFEGTSISNLSSALNMNRPSIYASFGNKEHLFKRCTEKYLAEKLSFIDEAMNEKNTLMAFEALFKKEIELISHGKGCLLVNTALTCNPMNEAIKTMLTEHRKTLESKFRKRIQLAQLKKEVGTKESPATLAKYIASIYQGLSVQTATGATNRGMREVVKIALKIFE